jgi:hypothetical protein
MVAAMHPLEVAGFDFRFRARADAHAIRARPGPFWRFLALALWVHVGKSATMALGATRVDPA